MNSKTTDPNKKYVQTGKDGKVTAFYIDQVQFSLLGKLILYRLIHDRDIKIVITGKGKSTGTGKTTLAIWLAKWINAARNDLFGLNEVWSSKEYAFMDVWDYLERYVTAKPGDPLITDELEVMADKRRSPSHQNVYFSQAWGMLRYKNAITLGTAPHMSDLDKRIPEGTDIWINVTQKGRANTYFLTMNDFNWDEGTIPRRLSILGYRETILWSDLEEDEDYKYLKSIKEEKGVPGMSNEKITEEDLEKQKQNFKQKATIKLLKLVEEKDLMGTLTQHDIGEIVGYSQQNVAKIKREEL